MRACQHVNLYSLPEANSLGFRSGILSGQSFRCPIRKFQYVVIFHSLDVIASIHNVNVASRQRTPEILRISDGRRGFPFAPLCAPCNLKGRPCHSYANLWRRRPAAVAAGRSPLFLLCAPCKLQGRPCNLHANLWRNFGNIAKFRQRARGNFFFHSEQ